MPIADIVLWEQETAELVGFAIVSPYHNLRFHFPAGALSDDIGVESVTWAVGCSSGASRLALAQGP